MRKVSINKKINFVGTLNPKANIQDCWLVMEQNGTCRTIRACLNGLHNNVIVKNHHDKADQ